MPMKRPPSRLPTLALLIAVFDVSLSRAFTTKIGRQRSGLLRGQLQRQLLLQQQARLRTGGDNLLVPRPNDTITDSYWAMVDRSIRAAELRATPPPPAAPGLRRRRTRGHGVQSADVTAEEEANGVVVSSMPAPTRSPWAATRLVEHINGAPYGVHLGAYVLNGLLESDKNKPTALPTQQEVNQQFVSQCPLLMFQDEVDVAAPTCGQRHGTWLDAASRRPVLRWKPTGGGVHFGVDSVVQGNGSVTFATITQQVTVTGLHFKLTNCLNVVRYTVDEEVVKINHMGKGIKSTSGEHDLGAEREAFFYRYTIRHPNGSAVAESGLVRLDQDEFNITMIGTLDSSGTEVSSGALVAQATRSGEWTRDDWRKCGGAPREWRVHFALGPRDTDMVATVMDLRVASAALVTLMAFRDETVDSSGVSSGGQRDLIKHLLWCGFLLLIVLLCFFGCIQCLRWRKLDIKFKRCCFAFEAATLPKRPVWVRAPPFFPTY